MTPERLTGKHAPASVLSRLLIAWLLIGALAAISYGETGDSADSAFFRSSEVQPATRFVFINSHTSRPFVTIDLATGAVTLDPKYTPDEAASKFWRVLAHVYPDVMRRRPCTEKERP